MLFVRLVTTLIAYFQVEVLTLFIVQVPARMVNQVVRVVNRLKAALSSARATLSCRNPNSAYVWCPVILLYFVSLVMYVLTCIWILQTSFPQARMLEPMRTPRRDRHSFEGDRGASGSHARPRFSDVGVGHRPMRPPTGPRGSHGGPFGVPQSQMGWQPPSFQSF